MKDVEAEKEPEVKEEEVKRTQMDSSIVTKIDYARIIDILLLAKNCKLVRQAAECITKGLWSTGDDFMKKAI